MCPHVHVQSPQGCTVADLVDAHPNLTLISHWIFNQKTRPVIAATWLNLTLFAPVDSAMREQLPTFGELRRTGRATINALLVP